MGAVQQAANELSWRAWTTLGVSGVAPTLESILIDPEGLIIFTALTCGDPRLLVESRDWLANYDTYIMKGRLKYLTRGLPKGAKKLLSEYLAGDSSATGRSTWPDTSNPALARLRYRLLFGRTSRAEILLSLRTARGSRSALDVSGNAGFAKRQTAITLEELVLAKLVRSETVGNRTVYSLKHSKRLDAFAGKPALADVDWQKLAIVTHEVLALEEKTPRVQQVRMAAILRENDFRDVDATLSGWTNHLEGVYDERRPNPPPG